MHMNKKMIIVLLTAMMTLFAIDVRVSANTQNVPLAVLKDGTNDTSYAASYFANSASVSSLGNGQYTVTSTVTTSKQLGDYPVQIISIDGAGANVSRTDNGSSQTITYSFQTTDLQRLHGAVIKVDVNSLNYHHTYNVGLQLDVSGFKPDVTQAPTTKKQTAASSATSQATQAETSEKVVSDASTSQTNESAKSSQANHASQAEPAKQTKANDRENKSDTLKSVGGIVLGGLSVGILAAVGTIWYISRKM